MEFKLTKKIISFPRMIKKILAMLVDASLCVLSVWLAFYLRTGLFIYFSEGPFVAIILSIIIALPIFYLSGFYSVIIRYSGWSILRPITVSIVIYGLIFASIVTVYGINNIPRTIGLLQPLLLFVLLICSRRLIFYWLNDSLNKFDKKKNRALIYGAGYAGQQLLSTFSNSYEFKIMGFIDDNTILKGNILNGKKIFSSDELDNLILEKKITHVLLAIPSVSRFKRNQIISKLTKKNLIIRTVPSLIDLANGHVTFSDLRDYEISDLLEREVVKPNYDMLSKNVFSNIILITGAGGSIGSELARQIINLNPKKLLLLDHNEYSLYKIQLELKNILKYQDSKEVNIVSILGSLQDINFVNNVLNTHKPDIVYHAAAYKHVSLVEENLIEGVKNNIFGSLNILKSSIKFEVKNLVLISTDKAVRPTSVMGASKRFTEICLQSLQDFSLQHSKEKKKTTMCMVRFGNALDSSGSVIPLFKKQIQDGGPITLTDKNVSRYFMTIPEAAQLVLQAGSMAEGGDVFVLDMDKSVKIIDLAKRMIKLSGLTYKDKNNLDGDIEINEIGLSKGEKLYEELLLGDDPQPTKHPKIKKAKDPFLKWEKLETIINQIDKELIKNNSNTVSEIIKKTISDSSSSF
jgi:FlaA1/EpsC-like NDP-sugar epimerase